MFWIVLIVSAIAVAAFACVGISDQGISFLNMQFRSVLNTTFMTRGEFYKFIFIQYGIGWWLTWVATILAIVSTAGIFPDLISGGAIDLYLSKPISRLRLFLTKYLSALLFVALQTSVFAAASFLLIGIRGRDWEPGLFWSIPIVVLFYSYIYAICVLLGVLTRSTVASMLLTLLIWFLLSMTQVAQSALHEGAIAGEVQREDYDKLIHLYESQIAMQRARPQTSMTATAITANQTQLDKVTQEKADAESKTSTVKVFDRITTIATTVLPKTQRTIDLMSDKIIESAHLDEIETRRLVGTKEQQAQRAERRAAFRRERGEEVDGKGSLMRWDSRVVKRALADEHEQSKAFIIGSSLAFEVLVLAWSAWVFCRRDY